MDKLELPPLPATPTWWANENSGEVSCARHGGMYLETAVRAHPERIEHVTPLGTWLKLGPKDQAEFLAAVGASSMDELCGDVGHQTGATA